MKEIKATLKILLGICIFFLFIHVLTLGEIGKYFNYSLFAFLIIFLVISILHYFIRSKKTFQAQNFIKRPAEIIIIFGQLFMFYAMILMTLYLYLIICLLIVKGIIAVILIIPLRIELSAATVNYLRITLTVTVAVLMNTPLKKLLNLVIPLKRIFEKFQYEKLKTSIDYLLNEKNVRYLIYGFYFIVVIISSLDTFQNTVTFQGLADSNVILKSFATFIALDKCIDLVSKIEFRPSEFFVKLKELFEISKKI